MAIFSPPGSPKPLTDFHETWNLELPQEIYPHVKLNFYLMTKVVWANSQFAQYVSFFAFLVSSARPHAGRTVGRFATKLGQ